jgi:hypothetical protein
MGGSDGAVVAGDPTDPTGPVARAGPGGPGGPVAAAGNRRAVGVATGAVLRFAGPADAGDLAAFLGRAVRLDPAALVRLRGAGRGAITAYVWLPFGVLVSRSARTAEAPPDATVGAAPLLEAVEAADGDQSVALPARQDAAWRGQLPATSAWQRLDQVPVDVVARLVRAGATTLQAIGGQGNAGLSESLLDHGALTVTGDGRSVVLPLRVLSAAWRMGFLGDSSTRAATAEGTVAVSVQGSWARLAAPYGSAYHQTSQGLLVRPR